MRFKYWLALFTALAAPLTAKAAEFAANMTEVQEPEMGLLKIAQINYDGEQFSIVPPAGWRMEVSKNAPLLRFVSPSSRSELAIQFIGKDVLRMPLSSEAIRQEIVPHLNTATVTEEFTVYGGAGEGKALLLQDGRTASRVGVIPLGRSCISFVLACSEDEEKPAHHIFGGALRFIPADQIGVSK